MGDYLSKWRLMSYFLLPGVPEGERETAAPRHTQQGSDAAHHHPTALVPRLPHTDALPAQERCSHADTGIPA